MTASALSLHTENSDIAEMQRIFDMQKTAFRLRPSTTASERLALLDNLKKDTGKIPRPNCTSYF